MKATLSLLGLYNYDNTILDGLVLPSNFDSSDNDVLKDNLLMETAELEILYTEPDFLKDAITKWCSKESAKWNWLKATQQYEYNPIWNADYNITDNNLQTRDLAGTNDTTQQYTRNLAEHETNEGETTETITNHTNVRSGDDTTTNSVYSYNETSTAQPREKSVIDYNSRNTENGTTLTEFATERNQTQTGGSTTTTDNDTTDTGTINTDYSRYLRGNYGQTTTQEMIKQEQELAKINLLDFIIEEFKRRFCVLVY